MLVVLDAKVIKELFREIKPIYRSVQDGAIMGWELKNHTLTVTCKNGIIYEKRITCEQEGPYSITVLYKDLSELISGRGTIQLDLQPLYIGISTESLQTVLTQAHGLLSSYQRRGRDYKDCSSSALQWMSQKFSELSPVAKSLKSEASLLCAPPYSILKYATIWLQADFDMFNTSLSLQDLKAVANFKPTSYAVADDVIEFKRHNTLLALPRTPVESCKSVKDVLQNPSQPHLLWQKDLLADVQKFQRSVGPGPCSLRFFTDGYQLAVDNPSYTCSVKFGKCSQHLYTLSTYVEYLPMMFRIFDMSDTYLIIGQNAVALKQNDVIMLHSVI